MAGRKANSFYMLTGQIISKAGLFVSLMIYSRILDSSSFGELLFAISIGLIIVFMSDMGVTMLVTRRIAAGGSEVKLLSSAFSLRSSLSLITLTSVLLFGWFGGYSNSQLSLILLVGIGFVLDGFCESSFAAFRGKGVMIYEAIAKIIQGVLGILLALYALKTSQGKFFAAGTYALRQIPAVIFVFVILLYRMSFRLKWYSFSFSSVFPLLKAAFPLGVAGVLFATGKRVDSFFIKAFLGNEAIAAYQQCIKIFEGLFLIVTPTLLPGALFASLCQSVLHGWERVQERIIWMTELFFVIAFALIIPLWAVSERLLQILWGNEYLRGLSMREMDISFKIILLTLPVAYMYSMFMSVIIALEEQKKAVPVIALSVAVEILLLVVLLPSIGIVGAAVAHFVLLFLGSVLLCFTLRNKFGVSGFIQGAKRPLLAVIPSFILLYLLQFGDIQRALLAFISFILFWLLLGGKQILPSLSKRKAI